MILQKSEQKKGFPIEAGKEPVYYRMRSVYFRYVYKSIGDAERDKRDFKKLCLQLFKHLATADQHIEKCKINDPDSGFPKSDFRGT